MIWKIFRFFLIKFLNENIHITCSSESLIRVYAYTGEFTSDLIRKIEKENKDEGVVKNMRNKYENQQEFFERMRNFNFFELRTYPLHYRDGKIFQKGVDVQLAVDLVSHAFKDNFDVAVICSGDIDLLESIKIVKSLGKKVILVSHKELMAKKLRIEADYFIDLSKLNDIDKKDFLFKH